MGRAGPLPAVLDRADRLVYGAHGPNFVKTMARLAAERDTGSVVDDQRGQPTWTVDLAAAIVRLVEAEAQFGTYHGTSSGETTWHGFAQAIFAELGMDSARVLPTTSAVFPLPAHRPAYSVLVHEAWRGVALDPLPSGASPWRGLFPSSYPADPARATGDLRGSDPPPWSRSERLRLPPIVSGHGSPDRDGNLVSRDRILRLLPLGLMAAIVLVTFAAIVYTLPRGFDWTDEAFGYALVASNRIAIDVPLGFQHLLHPLYVLTGESVLAFRIVRLAGYVLLSVALVWCVRTVFRRLGISIPRSGWALILLSAQVGTFLAWSYAPRYPGYNELTSWFVQLGVALIVVSLAWGVSAQSDQGAPWALWLIWAGLGALTILLVFAKVTSGMAFGAILMVAVVMPNPSLGWWKRLVSAGAGAMAVLLVLWLSGAPTLSYVKRAFVLVFDESAQASFGHPMSVIIWKYWDSLLVTGRNLLPALVIFALTMVTFSRPVRQDGGSAGGPVADRITWIFGALLVIALIALPRLTNWEFFAELVVFTGAAGIIGLALLGSQGARMRGSTASRSLAVALGGSVVVAGPFIGALGTNNPLTGHLVFSATLWAVVLGTALALLTRRATLLRSRAHGVPAVIGCVVILLAAGAVKADIAEPYRNEPLLSQKTPTSVPELRGLQLTKADAAYYDWISAAGRSLRAAGVPATATGSPGELYVFNHSGYASPWVGTMSQGPYRSLVAACTKHPPADLFVLQRVSTLGKYPTVHLTSSLASCGISFPDDFQVVAQRDSADPKRAMTIWRLKKSGASS